MFASKLITLGLEYFILYSCYVMCTRKKVQSTLVISNSKGLYENTSIYPYLEISELQKWGKQ